jgi:putative ABC transport system ATP-binding protein
LDGGSIVENILKIQNVEKYYGNKDNVTKALDNVSFKVKKGEFVGIMGPSGSGKTTLLNCISTIDNVTTGSIIIDDDDITRLKSRKIEKFRRDKLGFIFQDFNLLDTLTAYENIALALTIAGKKGKEVDELVRKSAESLEISQVLNKYPYQMSGGQKQRVASGRAIVNSPKLILADEPTGALDSKSAKLLLNSIEKLNKELEATILMVTHDAFTASYARRILFIKDGKIFNELVRGEDSRKEFFNKIIDIVTLLGGDSKDVF